MPPLLERVLPLSHTGRLADMRPLLTVRRPDPPTWREPFGDLLSDPFRRCIIVRLPPPRTRLDDRVSAYSLPINAIFACGRMLPADQRSVNSIETGSPAFA